MIIATGRMFRAVQPYLEQAGLDDPVVCYQGAAVVDPHDGAFLLHEPLPLETARSAIALLDEAGHPPNCYVDDELYVAHQTPYSRAYAEFQHLPVTEVGDLLGWLSRPPTKLVAVGEPEELAALREPLRERLGDWRVRDDIAAVSARDRQRLGIEGHRCGLGGGPRRLRRRAGGRVWGR